MSRDKRILVGIDEAGFGAIAGPTTICAVALKPEWLEEVQLRGFRDSKKIGPERRKELATWIAETKAAEWVIVNTPAHVIDRVGPLDAVCKGARTALIMLSNQMGFGGDLSNFRIIMDGKNRLVGLPAGTSHKAIIGADDRILEVSVASVLAKVHRDFLMDHLAERYPVYRWDENKGYGTLEHYEALYYYGPMPEHRMITGVRRGVRRYWEQHHKAHGAPLPPWVRSLYKHVPGEAPEKEDE